MSENPESNDNKSFEPGEDEKADDQPEDAEAKDGFEQTQAASSEDDPGKENVLLAQPSQDDEDDYFAKLEAVKPEEPVDPETAAQNQLMQESTPTTPLEIALDAALKRKELHLQRLSAEIQKLKAFVSKRKQTYKRKRKDEGAPTRALSAYNIFIQDRFARLAKENEKALKSEDLDAQLKRVPPANLVASTGNEWKELPPEEKAKYEER